MTHADFTRSSPLFRFVFNSNDFVCAMNFKVLGHVARLALFSINVCLLVSLWVVSGTQLLRQAPVRCLVILYRLADYRVLSFVHFRTKLYLQLCIPRCYLFSSIFENLISVFASSFYFVACLNRLGGSSYLKLLSRFP